MEIAGVIQTLYRENTVHIRTEMCTFGCKPTVKPGVFTLKMAKMARSNTACKIQCAPSSHIKHNRWISNTRPSGF
jgi:hypothetical protein